MSATELGRRSTIVSPVRDFLRVDGEFNPKKYGDKKVIDGESVRKRKWQAYAHAMYDYLWVKIPYPSNHQFMVSLFLVFINTIVMVTYAYLYGKYSAGYTRLALFFDGETEGHNAQKLQLPYSTEEGQCKWVPAVNEIMGLSFLLQSIILTWSIALFIQHHIWALRKSLAMQKLYFVIAPLEMGAHTWPGGWANYLDDFPGQTFHLEEIDEKNMQDQEKYVKTQRDQFFQHCCFVWVESIRYDPTSTELEVVVKPDWQKLRMITVKRSETFADTGILPSLALNLEWDSAFVNQHDDFKEEVKNKMAELQEKLKLWQNINTLIGDAETITDPFQRVQNEQSLKIINEYSEAQVQFNTKERALERSDDTSESFEKARVRLDHAKKTIRYLTLELDNLRGAAEMNEQGTVRYQPTSDVQEYSMKSSTCCKKLECPVLPAAASVVRIARDLFNVLFWAGFSIGLTIGFVKLFAWVVDRWVHYPMDQSNLDNATQKFEDKGLNPNFRHIPSETRADSVNFLAMLIVLSIVFGILGILYLFLYAFVMMCEGKADEKCGKCGKCSCLYANCVQWFSRPSTVQHKVAPPVQAAGQTTQTQEVFEKHIITIKNPFFTRWSKIVMGLLGLHMNVMLFYIVSDTSVFDVECDLRTDYAAHPDLVFQCSGMIGGGTFEIRQLFRNIAFGEYDLKNARIDKPAEKQYLGAWCKGDVCKSCPTFDDDDFKENFPSKYVKETEAVYPGYSDSWKACADEAECARACGADIKYQTLFLQTKTYCNWWLDETAMAMAFLAMSVATVAHMYVLGKAETAESALEECEKIPEKPQGIVPTVQQALDKKTQLELNILRRIDKFEWKRTQNASNQNLQTINVEVTLNQAGCVYFALVEEVGAPELTETQVKTLENQVKTHAGDAPTSGGVSHAVAKLLGYQGVITGTGIMDVLPNLSSNTFFITATLNAEIHAELDSGVDVGPKLQAGDILSFTNTTTADSARWTVKSAAGASVTFTKIAVQADFQGDLVGAPITTPKLAKKTVKLALVVDNNKTYNLYLWPADRGKNINDAGKKTIGPIEPEYYATVKPVQCARPFQWTTARLLECELETPLGAFVVGRGGLPSAPIVRAFVFTKGHVTTSGGEAAVIGLLKGKHAVNVASQIPECHGIITATAGAAAAAHKYTFPTQFDRLQANTEYVVFVVAFTQKNRNEPPEYGAYCLTPTPTVTTAAYEVSIDDALTSVRPNTINDTFVKPVTCVLANPLYPIAGAPTTAVRAFLFKRDDVGTTTEHDIQVFVQTNSVSQPSAAICNIILAGGHQNEYENAQGFTALQAATDYVVFFLASIPKKLNERDLHFACKRIDFTTNA